MRTKAITGALIVSAAAAWTFTPTLRVADHPVAAQGLYGKRVQLQDDCDPADEAWDAIGGCTKRGGDVTVEEFNALLLTPLATASPSPVIGHQAWRNYPTYLKVRPGQPIDVTNRGGRVHTFTEVANFGGGRVPPLRQGFAPAPECATAVDLAPRAAATVVLETEGNHHFQCCIHPWMRTTIKVVPGRGARRGEADEN